MPARKKLVTPHWLRIFTIILLISLLLPSGAAFAQSPSHVNRKAIALQSGLTPVNEKGPWSSGIAAALTSQNLIQDGSFEAYRYPDFDSPYWNQSDSEFETPLCTGDDCGYYTSAHPYNGYSWAWFGGTKSASHESSLSQDVTFPSCGIGYLQFYFWIGYAQPGSSSDDVFQAKIDGYPMFTANATQIGAYSAYTFVQIPVNAFDPLGTGGKHTIEFSSNSSTQEVDFNLDDVSLIWTSCPTISGNAGAPNVELQYLLDGRLMSVFSGQNGDYSIQVPTAWTGSVTPVHDCYTFTPASRSYLNLSSEKTAQRFTAVFDPDSGCANVNAAIGGNSRGNYGVPFEGSLHLSYASTDSGAVKLDSSNTVPIVASERINLKTNNVYSSYSEVMGIPSSKLSDTYIFPWYNSTGLLDSQLRFGNVGTETTTVTIKIGGVIQDQTYTLAPSQSVRVSYPGVDSGPVEVKSSGGVPIIAALRTNLKRNSSFSSYSEFLGLPASDTASTRYLFPWYNNTGLLDSQLRIGNIGDQTTTVTVLINGFREYTYVLEPNQSTRVSYPDLDEGPVEVSSSDGVPITAAMRINLKNNPTFTSYTELMGMPGTTLTETRYFFPWYNNTGLLDSQLRFANVGSSDTTVTIKIGGVEQPTTYPLAPNQSVRVSLPNTDSGLVEVYSSNGVPIIAALRINLKRNSTFSSYYEFMGSSVGSPLGLPANQLSPTYWFPWYNNTGLLDSQLEFAVP